jgi:hypothetical protein
MPVAAKAGMKAMLYFILTVVGFARERERDFARRNVFGRLVKRCRSGWGRDCKAGLQNEWN